MTTATPPLVSIIVPSFRHERFVVEALDSCAASTYPNIELIVANDASPEGDDAKIRSWISSHPSLRVQYVHHEVNQGITRTLNECIALSKGAFIALLAADDVLFPTSIARRVRYLQQHPELLAVFSDCEVIDVDGNHLFDSAIEGLHRDRRMRRWALRDPALLPLEIVFHWAVPGPAFMARRETYDLVGLYDESLRIEDWDMYMRIAARQRLGFLDECTAQYRWQQTNTTNDPGLKQRRDGRRIAAKLAPSFSGIARAYLTALGQVAPLNRESPLRDQIRMRVLGRVARASHRAYLAYRRAALLARST